MFHSLKVFFFDCIFILYLILCLFFHGIISSHFRGSIIKGSVIIKTSSCSWHSEISVENSFVYFFLHLFSINNIVLCHLCLGIFIIIAQPALLGIYLVNCFIITYLISFIVFFLFQYLACIIGYLSGLFLTYDIYHVHSHHYCRHLIKFYSLVFHYYRLSDLFHWNYSEYITYPLVDKWFL